LLDGVLAGGIVLTRSARYDQPPPRVAFLARNLTTGGAERVFINLVNHARTIDPIPVFLRQRGALLADLAPGLPRVGLDHPITGDFLAAETLETLPLGSAALLVRECRRLVRLVDQQNVSLVSSFLMRSHLVALLAKAMFRPRLKVVLNIHEHLSQSAGFLYPRRRDRVVAEWVARTLFPKADRIAVVAEELRRDLIGTYGIRDELIRIAYNPLDIDLVRARSALPVANGFPGHDGRPTICAVGRLVYLKGYDVLLHAVAMLKATTPVRLLIVGDGEERQVLESIASQLGLAHDVRFVGWQANPWSYLKRSQMLVLSSRTEAFPSVLTEAMALRVPVVAAECSAGVRECLDEGRAGCLVPPDDPGALARGIAKVLAETVYAASLVECGARFVERFRLSDAVPAYEELLMDVMEPVPHAPRARGPTTPTESSAVPADA
jgi:glycosyltransferase involved in cell wall biosynthesis